MKFTEGRGLRRAKDPYIVVVFQRNELVSKGPRADDDEEEDDGYRSPAGAIPMSRAGSESGRPMAIPMKSRQSSSTSLTEYRDFKLKTRKSTTNPKWDAEGVL
jgi:protein-serine/threonine kinase